MSSLHLGAVGLKIVGLGSKEKDPDEPETKGLTETIMDTVRRSKPWRDQKTKTHCGMHRNNECQRSTD